MQAWRIGFPFDNRSSLESDGGPSKPRYFLLHARKYRDMAEAYHFAAGGCHHRITRQDGTQDGYYRGKSLTGIERITRTEPTNPRDFYLDIWDSRQTGQLTLSEISRDLVGTSDMAAAYLVSRGAGQPHSLVTEPIALVSAELRDRTSGQLPSEQIPVYLTEPHTLQLHKVGDSVASLLRKVQAALLAKSSNPTMPVALFLHAEDVAMLQSAPEYAEFLSTHPVTQIQFMALAETLTPLKGQNQLAIVSMQTNDLELLMRVLGVKAPGSATTYARSLNAHKTFWIPSTVLCVMLFAAQLATLPYTYYMLLRWSCFLFFGYLAYTAQQQRKTYWMWSLACVALLYNPVGIIGFKRATWEWINYATIVAVLISVLTLRPVWPGTKINSR